MKRRNFLKSLLVTPLLLNLKPKQLQENQDEFSLELSKYHESLKPSETTLHIKGKKIVESFSYKGHEVFYYDGLYYLNYNTKNQKLIGSYLTGNSITTPLSTL